MHFDVLNSKMQDFRLNKTICYRISPSTALMSTTTRIIASLVGEENVTGLTRNWPILQQIILLRLHCGIFQFIT